MHPLGNPHYLLDPLNGLRVAKLLAERFSSLRPSQRDAFTQRLEAFQTRLAESLIGKKLVAAYKAEDIPKLLALLERGGAKRFVSFLEGENQKDLLGGWLGALLPWSGALCIADHDTWPYFARRFGLEVIAFLEPKPGLAPTTRHLGDVVRRARAEKASVVLSCPYFKVRHAEFVARHAGLKVVAMAHQTGSRKGVDSYLELFDHNVQQLVDALKAQAGRDQP